MANDRSRYLVEFEVLDDQATAAHRLRRMLKHALRTCGLRCIRATEVNAPNPDPDPPEPERTLSGSA
jgi:hypothetical protein